MTREIGEVEKGIEIPRPKRGKFDGQGKYRSKADLMEVGDSFLIRTHSTDRHRVQSCVLASLARYSGRKFTTRKVEDGVRVWRIR